MEKYYKEIIVKSKADLPKETGSYITFEKNTGWTVSLLDFEVGVSEPHWGHVDWWLQEVKDPSEVPFKLLPNFKSDVVEKLTREELINKLCELNDQYQKLHDWWLKSEFE